MSTSSAVQQGRPYETLIADIRSQAVLEAGSGSSFEIAASVIDQIASADSVEAVFAANDSGPADMADYLNVPLSLYGIRFFKSSEKYMQNGQGIGVYVVLNVYDTDGNDVLLSTGAPNVVASVYRFQRIEAFSEDKPLLIKIVGRETANGTLYTVAKP